MQHQSSGLSLAANEIVIYEIILLHNKGHFNLELLDISFTSSHLANITLGREFAKSNASTNVHIGFTQWKTSPKSMKTL